MFEYAKTLMYAKLFKQEPEYPMFSDFPNCDLQWERLTCIKLLYASPGYFPEYPPEPPMNFYLRLFLSTIVVGFFSLVAYMFFEMYEEQIMKAIELTKGAIKYCEGYRKSFASKQCKAESQAESAILDVNPASHAFFYPAVVSQWRDQADLAFPFASPNSIGSFSSYSGETDDVSNFFSDVLDMFTSPSSIEDPAEPLHKEIAQLKEERANLTVGLVVLVQERFKLQSQLRLEEQRTAEMQASVEELSATHNRISERQVGRITTLLDSINERAEEATELRSTESTLREQIVLLSAQVSGLSSKITSLSSQVDALSTQHQQDLVTISDLKFAQEHAAAVAKANSDNQQDRIAQLSAQCEQNEVLIADLNAASARNAASSAQQKAAQDQEIAQLQAQLAQAKDDALTARNAHQSEAKKGAQKLEAAQKEAATEKRTKERCIKLAQVAHKVFASIKPFDIISNFTETPEDFDLSTPVFDPKVLGSRKSKLKKLKAKARAESHPDLLPEDMKPICTEITHYIEAATNLYVAEYDIRISTLNAKPKLRKELEAIYRGNCDDAHEALGCARLADDQPAMKEYMDQQKNYAARLRERGHADQSTLMQEFQQLHPLCGWMPDSSALANLVNKWTSAGNGAPQEAATRDSSEDITMGGC